MPRTDLESLAKRQPYSQYWRELSAAQRLKALTQHELLRPAERRAYERELATSDAEQLARSVTALKAILIIRERKRRAFEQTYPLLTRLRAAA